MQDPQPQTLDQTKKSSVIDCGRSSGNLAETAEKAGEKSVSTENEEDGNETMSMDEDEMGLSADQSQESGGKTEEKEMKGKLGFGFNFMII